MRTTLLGGLLAAVTISLAALPSRAQAQQTPNVLYELDYAVSAGSVYQSQSSDTIVSIGMPHNGRVPCYVAVAWYDKTGGSQGTSGPILLTTGAVSITTNFTSNPYISCCGSRTASAYFPYLQDVGRSLPFEQPFEGYAQIRSSCPVGTMLRVDAELASRYPDGTYAYKPINVTNPSGVSGY